MAAHGAAAALAVEEVTPEADRSLLGALGLTRVQDRAVAKDLQVSPLIGPFYTPETEFGMNVGGLFSWTTDPADPDLERSSLRAFGFYTSNQTKALGLGLSVFFPDDAYRVEIGLAGRDMPDHYFGVGFENGRDRPEGSGSTRYERVGLNVIPELNKRIRGNTFAGLRGEISYVDADEVPPPMAMDPDFQAFGPEVWSSGLGFLLLHDSRDVTVNAFRGIYRSLQGTLFSEGLGGDSDFQMYDVDFRTYRHLWRPGATVAYNARAIVSQGDVPWPEFPTLGGGRSLRGYRRGRFRDEAVVWNILEYRHMLARPRLKRFGFVAFAGVGWIGSDLGDLGGHVLPNGGGGLRFELQERRNLRLDAGWGRGDRGFYFGIHEAF